MGVSLRSLPCYLYFDHIPFGVLLEIIDEDILTPITAAHHVIERTAVFKAKGARHPAF
jgi:hypothetical protein